MNFTRRIPGIRPPIPGRLDRSATGAELFVSGWSAALVWLLLHGVLGIYLFCTFRSGGHAAEFWLDDHGAGLSLWELASVCNLAFAVLLATGTRPRRSDWKRSAGILFALGVLGLTQVYLNGWKRIARDDREWTQTWLDDQQEYLRVLRDEIRRSGDHPWAGEYVGVVGNQEFRRLLAATGEGARLDIDEGAASATSLRERFESCRFWRQVAVVRGDRLVLSNHPRAFETWQAAIVEWGERRYLVESGALERFLAAAHAEPDSEPETTRSVLLRLGDEARPLSGAPRVAALTGR